MPSLFTDHTNPKTQYDYIRRLRHLAEKHQKGSLSQPVEHTPLFPGRETYVDEDERYRYKFALLYMYLFTQYRPAIGVMLAAYYDQQNKKHKADAYRNAPGDNNEVVGAAFYPFLKIASGNYQHADKQSQLIKHQIIDLFRGGYGNIHLQAELKTRACFELELQDEDLDGEHFDADPSRQDADQTVVNKIDGLLQRYENLRSSRDFYSGLIRSVLGKPEISRLVGGQIKRKQTDHHNQLNQSLGFINRFRNIKGLILSCLTAASASLMYAYHTAPVTEVNSNQDGLVFLTHTITAINLLTANSGLITDSLNRQQFDLCRTINAMTLMGVTAWTCWSFLNMPPITDDETIFASTVFNAIASLFPTTEIYQTIRRFRISHELDAVNNFQNSLEHHHPLTNRSTAAQNATNADPSSARYSLFHFEPSSDWKQECDKWHLESIAELK